MLEEAPTRVAEAVVAVLAEVGSRTAHDALERLARNRRGLKPAIRTALRHIGERAERGDRARPRGAGPSRPPRAVRSAAAPGRRPDGSGLGVARPARLPHARLPVAPSARARARTICSSASGRDGRRRRDGENFHPTLSYIRSVLPPAPVAPILREAEFYRLNPAYPLTCDVWDFERALDEARAARGIARSSHAHSVARPRWPVAPFLQGLYADWADERAGAHARSRRAPRCSTSGPCAPRPADYEAALEHFRRAAEFDAYPRVDAARRDRVL